MRHVIHHFQDAVDAKIQRLGVEQHRLSRRIISCAATGRQRQEFLEGVAVALFIVAILLLDTRVNTGIFGDERIHVRLIRRTDLRPGAKNTSRFQGAKVCLELCNRDTAGRGVRGKCICRNSLGEELHQIRI